MADASSAPAVSTEGGAVAATGDGKDKAAVLGEPEDEVALRKKEAAELSQLIDDDTKNDVGCSATGLYELVGEFFLSFFSFRPFQSMGRVLTLYLYFSAIVTHKGAAADAGHYIGFVKKSVFHAYKNKGGLPSIASSSSTGAPGPVATDAAASPEMTTADLDALEDDEDWYKFDDERVSLFPKEKLATLDGGGEDSSAYVLLYRSKSGQ